MVVMMSISNIGMMHRLVNLFLRLSWLFRLFSWLLGRRGFVRCCLCWLGRLSSRLLLFLLFFFLLLLFFFLLFLERSHFLLLPVVLMMSEMVILILLEHVWIVTSLPLNLVVVRILDVVI